MTIQRLPAQCSIKQDGDKSCLLAISGLSRSYRDPVAVPTRLGGGRDRNSRDRKKALKPPCNRRAFKGKLHLKQPIFFACVNVGKISNRAKGLYRYNPNPPVHPGVLLVLGLGRGARTRARDEPHLRVR